MVIQLTRETAIISFLAFVLVASGFDIALDLSHGAPFSHIFKEALIALSSAFLVGWILLEQFRQTIEIKALRKELERSRQPEAMSEYVQDVRKQLSEVIAQQFEDWQLTTSEKAVGWLLLKGLSLREISVVRDTSEKTARQQASDIYKKARLSGRHAFAAWFIEDLF